MSFNTLRRFTSKFSSRTRHVRNTDSIEDETKKAVIDLVEGRGKLMLAELGQELTLLLKMRRSTYDPETASIVAPVPVRPRREPALIIDPTREEELHPELAAHDYKARPYAVSPTPARSMGTSSNALGSQQHLPEGGPAPGTWSQTLTNAFGHSDQPTSQIATSAEEEPRLHGHLPFPGYPSIPTIPVKTSDSLTFVRTPVRPVPLDQMIQEHTTGGEFGRRKIPLQVQNPDLSESERQGYSRTDQRLLEPSRSRVPSSSPISPTVVASIQVDLSCSYRPSDIGRLCRQCIREVPSLDRIAGPSLYLRRILVSLGALEALMQDQRLNEPEHLEHLQSLGGRIERLLKSYLRKSYETQEEYLRLFEWVPCKLELYVERIQVLLEKITLCPYPDVTHAGPSVPGTGNYPRPETLSRSSSALPGSREYIRHSKSSRTVSSLSRLSPHDIGPSLRQSLNTLGDSKTLQGGSFSQSPVTDGKYLETRLPHSQSKGTDEQSQPAPLSPPSPMMQARGSPVPSQTTDIFVRYNAKQKGKQKAASPEPQITHFFNRPIIGSPSLS
ncbi:hypothetical protein P691DRAFT_777530 [Macrolepiota fuliginosa MF-IS2]|uniref:Uncharacterized protein n=1 Tax=Macrolepiota fuliginosa MF-IS2 TaxID=1400762 RepID=A0A9P5X6P5_9AGAR|nr:hypothetical protein P691DRAFT_777530 [Macrolepiota fuliginosa MF-IS2]